MIDNYSLKITGSANGAAYLGLARKQLEKNVNLARSINRTDCKYTFKLGDGTEIKTGLKANIPFIEIAGAQNLYSKITDGVVRYNQKVGTDTLFQFHSLSRFLPWQSLLKHGIEPCEKFPNIKTGLTQHATVKSSMYSGMMENWSQMILGQGKQLRYRYDYYETDGVIIDWNSWDMWQASFVYDLGGNPVSEDRTLLKLYIIKVCQNGVFIKPLEYVDNGKDKLNKDAKFWEPVENGFDIDFTLSPTDLDAYLAANKIRKLVDATAMDQYVLGHQPYFIECGWAFPPNYSRRHYNTSDGSGYNEYLMFNTCHSGNAIGLLYRVSVKLNYDTVGTVVDYDDIVIEGSYDFCDAENLCPANIHNASMPAVSGYTIPNYSSDLSEDFTIIDAGPGLNPIAPIYAYYSNDEPLIPSSYPDFPSNLNNNIYGNLIKIVYNLRPTEQLVTDNELTIASDFLPESFPQHIISFTSSEWNSGGVLLANNAQLWYYGASPYSYYVVPPSGFSKTRNSGTTTGSGPSAGYTVRDTFISSRNIIIPFYNRNQVIYSENAPSLAGFRYSIAPTANILFPGNTFPPETFPGENYAKSKDLLIEFNDQNESDLLGNNPYSERENIYDKVREYSSLPKISLIRTLYYQSSNSSGRVAGLYFLNYYNFYNFSSIAYIGVDSIVQNPSFIGKP